MQPAVVAGWEAAAGRVPDATGTCLFPTTDIIKAEAQITMTKGRYTGRTFQIKTIPDAIGTPWEDLPHHIEAGVQEIVQVLQ